MIDQLDVNYPPVEQAYETVIRAIEQFFHDSGICIVTLQPEFLVANGKIIGGEQPAIADTSNCLMNCNHAECQEKACCKLDSENNMCRDAGTKAAGGGGGGVGGRVDVEKASTAQQI